MLPATVQFPASSVSISISLLYFSTRSPRLGPTFTNPSALTRSDTGSDTSNVNGNKQSSYIGPAGDTVIVTPQHQQSMGIPKSQIPNGHDDMYILKSQVVPPVCPACPNVSACPRPAPYPPCPPCSRCPEPSFECKKVPNYNNPTEGSYLPRPVLANFSQFGM